MTIPGAHHNMLISNKNARYLYIKNVCSHSQNLWQCKCKLGMLLGLLYHVLDMGRKEG
jgi:prephenate dehydratase